MKFPMRRLGEVAHLVRETTEASNLKENAFYLGLEHIESGGKIIGKLPITSGMIASSKFRFTKDHVLFGKLRPYLAKIATPDFDGYCSTDILPIEPGPDLNKSYLAHFLLQPETISLASSLATGANLPRLSPKTLMEFKIPIPPVEEQKRIADILDKADALRAKRRKTISLINSLTQSIFLEMFGDPVSNDRNWNFQKVSDFVDGFETGKSLSADDQNDLASPYRVLKISAVTSLEYKPAESKALPPNYIPPKSHFVKAGDLLFSRANTSELIGATAFVFNTPDNMLLPDKLWRFVWHETPKADPLFVWHLFRQPKFREEVSRRSTGSSGSMKNISQDKVLSIEVGLPDLELQLQFSKKIQGLQKSLDAFKKSDYHLSNLFISLQNHCFSGKL